MSVETRTLVAGWSHEPERKPWKIDGRLLLRRASTWLVLLVALGAAAGAAWLIEGLQEYADHRRQTQLVLGDIERLSGEVRYFELQSRSGWGLEVETTDFTPLLRSLERQLLKLEELDGHGDVSYLVREAVDQYTSNFDHYLRLVSRQHDAEEVRRWALERTQPSFQLLVEAVEQANVYFGAQSSRALHQANLGSKATIAVEALLLVMMTVLIHRIRRQDERRLAVERQRSEARFRSLVQNSSDAIEVVDRSGIVVYASDSVERILGRPPEASVGRSIFEWIHPDHREKARERFAEAVDAPDAVTQNELQVQREDGEWIWIETTAANLLDDANVEGMVINFRDISDRKALESELRQMALHDPLTGLANRTLLLDLLEGMLHEGQRHEFPVAICYLDLDGFKTINDNLGHKAGDQVLIWIAEHLRTVLRAGDLGSRLGGDEFALLLRGTDALAAEVVARRILKAVSSPIRLEGMTVSVGVSIGIAVAHRESLGAEELLHRADTAMYAAKSEGKGQYCIYEEGVEAEDEGEGSGDPTFQRQPLMALPGGRQP